MNIVTRKRGAKILDLYFHLFLVSSDLSRCVLCIVGSLSRSKENLVDCVELTSGK